MTSIAFELFAQNAAGNTIFVAEKGYLEKAFADSSLFPVQISTALFNGRDYFQVNSSTILAEFENETSRNLPFRVDKLKELVSKHAFPKGDFRIVLALEKVSQVLMAGLAVARLWPIYNKKSKEILARQVSVQFLLPNGANAELGELRILSDSLRKAQLLMDTPCSELNTTAYVEEARQLASSLGSEVSISVIQGDDLAKEFGGIHGVGKGAAHPPALVILQYQPTGATKTVALVGKGICFDTGGLSLKSTAGMCGMKFDLGGSAAVFGAFKSLVQAGVKKNVYGLLCLAENAIGPLSFRNDDILYMYSGKTVEVNNTDAEGKF